MKTSESKSREGFIEAICLQFAMAIVICIIFIGFFLPSFSGFFGGPCDSILLFGFESPST